jgi:hypothetical protein
MAYKDTIKLRAYTLYLQGLNFEQIATQLRKDFGLTTLRGQTIKSWAEKPDEDGKTWEYHRSRVRDALRQSAEKAYKTKYAEIRAKAETIQEALYAQLIDEKKAQIKSFEGAVYAFKGISEFVINLSEMEQNNQHPLVIIQAMLEVFQEIPAVRKAIKDNWAHIAKEIKNRLYGEAKQEVIQIEYRDEN